MKINKKIIIPFVLFPVLFVWLFLSNRDDVVIKASNKMQEKEIMNIPKEVRTEIMSDSFNSLSYRETAKRFSTDLIYHKKVGEDLYKVAFTKAMYKEEKIKILQASKEHLLIAKSLELKEGL